MTDELRSDDERAKEQQVRKDTALRMIGGLRAGVRAELAVVAVEAPAWTPLDLHLSRVSAPEFRAHHPDLISALKTAHSFFEALRGRRRGR